MWFSMSESSGANKRAAPGLAWPSSVTSCSSTAARSRLVNQCAGVSKRGSRCPCCRAGELKLRQIKVANRTYVTMPLRRIRLCLN